MVNQQLVNYIQSNLQRGASLQQIKQGLLAQGWSDYDINEAINLVQGQSNSKTSKKSFLIIAIIAVIVIAGIFAFFIFGEKEATEPKISDFTKCEQESLKTMKAICYTELAIEKNDVSICENYLENEQDKKFKDLCYRDFAIDNKDERICEKIESSNIKDQCNEELGIQQETAPTMPPHDVDYQDCGSSDTCFSDYVKTCTPAKATISDQGLTYLETIEGYEGDDCIITLVYTESPVPGFVGKEMSCKIPKSNLANFEDYLQGERMKQSCDGSLVDFLIQMGAE